MDISGLQPPRAVLTRNENTKTAYRLDAEKARAAVTAARETETPKDLLEIAGVTARDLAQLARDNGQQGVITVLSNYNVDTFFRPEMPETANADGTYTVDGVGFSESALAQAKAVMRTAADSISAGPGKNTNLDYRNYAQMAIAQNAVDTYGASHLSAEQAQVLSRAMRGYNEALVNMQNAVLGTSPDTSSYYGRAHMLSQNEADMLNSFKQELSALTGRTFRPSRAGDSGGYDQIATNLTRIGDITSLLEKADLTNSSGRTQAMQQYSSLVRPAYLEQGIRSADLRSVMKEDTARLLAGFDRIVSASAHFSFAV